jgi:hypothetical protein
MITEKVVMVDRIFRPLSVIRALLRPAGVSFQFHSLAECTTVVRRGIVQHHDDRDQYLHHINKSWICWLLAARNTLNRLQLTQFTFNKHERRLAGEITKASTDGGRSH